MHIYIGEKTREYMKILHIESYPFTESEIKDKYRMLVKIYHPDHNKNVDENYIKEINSAYDAIKNLAIANTSDEDRQQQINKFEADQDIFKLWKTCDNCKGSGKIEVPDTLVCPHCQSWDKNHSFFRLRHKDCRACKGTGKFQQRNGKIVTCLRCNGTGWYGMQYCPYCKNTGFIKNETRFKNCSNCSGTGKIEVKPFNPVIRKGAVL